MAPQMFMPIYTLEEIYRFWGVGRRAAYQTFAALNVIPDGRPGHRKYYRLDDIVRCFGQPATPSLLGLMAVSVLAEFEVRELDDDAKPRKRSGFELAEAA